MVTFVTNPGADKFLKELCQGNIISVLDTTQNSDYNKLKKKDKSIPAFSQDLNYFPDTSIFKKILDHIIYQNGLKENPDYIGKEEATVIN